MLESAISFVVVFAILVVFHELGHFLAARAFKMPILEFAVGFGPKILTIARQGILEYTLRLYPLGGFVKIRGMDAIHLASANTLGVLGHTLVTYDKNMAKAAKALGFNIESPGAKI